MRVASCRALLEASLRLREGVDLEERLERLEEQILGGEDGHKGEITAA